MNPETYGFALAAVSTVIGSIGALLLKMAAGQSWKQPFRLLFKTPLLLGLGCYGIAALLFVSALRFGELSFLYPIAGLSYVWITLLSLVILHEKIKPYQWLGICLIITGVVLIGMS